jgi:hypothetical protein
MNHRFIKKVVTFFSLFSMTAFGGGKNIFYIHTGTSLPLSPRFFKDAYSQGFDVGVMAGRRLTPRFEVQGALNINNFNFDRAGFLVTLDPEITSYMKKYGVTERPDLDIEGEAASAWNLYANLKWIFPPSKEEGKAEIYLFAGGGIFGFKKNRITVREYEDHGEIFSGHEKIVSEKSETVPGAAAGFGLDILLEEHTNFNVEFGVFTGFTSGDPTVFVPIRFGVSIRP